MTIIKDLNEISNDLTIVDFFATWCGPCRMLTPVLEELNEKQIVHVVKVDVDESIEMAKSFNVSVVPTLFLLKDKKVLSKKEGYMNLDEIEEWVNKYR